MVELNHHVGATERVQGGFLTANVDENSSGKGVKVMHPARYASLSMPVHTISRCHPPGTQFHMDPGMTAVQILDYSMATHCNLEADIRMPEDEGIVQVETFGCSINAYGTCFYGLQLEAVMDR